MIGFPARLFSRLRPGRRAVRRAVAAAVIGVGHLLLLLILDSGAPPEPPLTAEAPPPPADLTVQLQPPPPARPAPPTRRSRARTPPRQIANPRPAPTPRGLAAPAAPAPGSPPGPDYGRWTVSPEAEPAPGAAGGLGACTPLTLTTLTGAARDACARRLEALAPDAPTLPLTSNKRRAKELQAAADYQREMAAWRRSPELTARPCPPQPESRRKQVLDRCALMSGRVKLRF